MLLSPDVKDSAGKGCFVGRKKKRSFDKSKSASLRVIITTHENERTGVDRVLIDRSDQPGFPIFSNHV